MISILKLRWALIRFQKNWRRLNSHNTTTAGCIFNLNKVSVGNYTYGNLNVLDSSYDNEMLEIGHFCSIASGVKFILAGNHFMERPTTFPMETFFMGHCGGEGYSKGPITIGSDVWIGLDAWILSGLNVGQGAVIGAKSLVAKDVPPYAVVAGNPAKIIRYRFGDAMIQELLRIDYSMLNKEIIRKHMKWFTTPLNSIDLNSLQSVIDDIRLRSDKESL